jgi:hypothetical protein
MQITYAIGIIVPPLILLMVALKLHQRIKLPTLLLTGIVLIPIFYLPQALMMIAGTERTQSFLLEIFPNANDPERAPFPGRTVYGLQVGQVLWILQNTSDLIPGLALFVFGIGFFLHGRHMARIKEQTPISQIDVR